MSDLHDLTATQQLRALHTREIRSRDLSGHYLERIAQLDGELVACATVDPESALQEADRADERLARGSGHRCPDSRSASRTSTPPRACARRSARPR